MLKFLNKFKWLLLVELVLIANGVFTLLMIMPSWWVRGYYKLSVWVGASLSFGIAALLIAATIYEHVYLKRG